METLMSLVSQSSTNSEINDMQLSAMRDKNSKSQASSMIYNVSKTSISKNGVYTWEIVLKRDITT